MTQPAPDYGGPIIDMAIWYLRESGGNHWQFRKDLENPELRFGQSFFNCLNKEDQGKLRGTVYDTFYVEGRAQTRVAILFAIDHLTTKEK